MNRTQISTKYSTVSVVFALILPGDTWIDILYKQRDFGAVSKMSEISTNTLFYL